MGSYVVSMFVYYVAFGLSSFPIRQVVISHSSVISLVQGVRNEVIYIHFSIGSILNLLSLMHGAVLFTALYSFAIFVICSVSLTA